MDKDEAVCLDIFADSMLQEWIDREHGGMIKSYYLVVDFMDSDGREAFAYAESPGQLPHTTLGLLEFGKLLMTNDMRNGCDCDVDLE